MKKLLVAMIATIVAVGAISASITLGSDDNFTITSVNPLKSTAQVMGHIVLTVTDENGQITAYLQTDNSITNDGDQCIAEVILAGVTGGNCTAPTTADFFDNIAIGIGVLSPTDTTTRLTTYLTGVTSPVTFSSAALTHAGASAGASVLITAVFNSVDATITEAAIQAGTNTAGLASTLATQSFTGLPLGATDDLTILWTVVIAGS